MTDPPWWPSADGPALRDTTALVRGPIRADVCTHAPTDGGWMWMDRWRSKLAQYAVRARRPADGSTKDATDGDDRRAAQVERKHRIRRPHGAKCRSAGRKRGRTTFLRPRTPHGHAAAAAAAQPHDGTAATCAGRPCLTPGSVRSFELERREAIELSGTPSVGRVRSLAVSSTRPQWRGHDGFVGEVEERGDKWGAAARSRNMLYERWSAANAL